MNQLDQKIAIELIAELKQTTGVLKKMLNSLNDINQMQAKYLERHPSLDDHQAIKKAIATNQTAIDHNLAVVSKIIERFPTNS